MKTEREDAERCSERPRSEKVPRKRKNVAGPHQSAFSREIEANILRGLFKGISSCDYGGPARLKSVGLAGRKSRK